MVWQAIEGSNGQVEMSVSPSEMQEGVLSCLMRNLFVFYSNVLCCVYKNDIISHTQTHAAFLGPLRFVWCVPAACLSVGFCVSLRSELPRSVIPRLTQARNVSTLIVNAAFIHRLHARAHSMSKAPRSNSVAAVAPTAARARKCVLPRPTTRTRRHAIARRGA